MEGSLLARPLVAQDPEGRGYWESGFKRTSPGELKTVLKESILTPNCYVNYPAMNRISA